MTNLNKPVTRRTNATAHDGRALIVSLSPGASDLITVRESGRRRGYSVTVEQVFRLGARIAADQARAEKAKKRKERGR